MLNGPIRDKRSNRRRRRSRIDARTFYNRGVDPLEISRFPLTAAVDRRQFSVFVRQGSGLGCNVAISYDDSQGRQ